MTPRERYLLQRVARRAESLRKFADIALRHDSYIPIITAHAAWLLVRTLLLLCKAELYDYAVLWARKHLLQEQGMCDLCENVKENAEAPACDTCLAQMEEEDKQLQQYEQMEQPVPGKPQ